MAQHHPRAASIETDDPWTLSFSTSAPMSVHGSEATIGSEASTAVKQLAVSHSCPNQLLLSNTMAIPSPDMASSHTYHGTQQNEEVTVLSDFAARQSAQPPPQGVNHDEHEVEISCANEKQDHNVPQTVEPVGSVTEIAETQNDVSSEDLSEEDMSDGAESRMSPQLEDDIDRLDKYAFNCAGKAYDHRVPQHLTSGITIFAKKVTATITLLQYLESAENQGGNNVFPGLVPHEEEMKRKARKVECVWVGMLPNPQTKHKHTMSAPAPVKDEPKVNPVSPTLKNGKNKTKEAQGEGTSNTAKKTQQRSKKVQSNINIEDDQLDVLPYATNALRVVAKKQTRNLKTWHLYALALSEDGSKLCQGWKVGFDDVFFFKPFRDDTAAGIMKRRLASGNKITAATFPAEIAPAPVPQASVSVQQPAGLVPAPPTPTPGDLPTPKSSGRKGEASDGLGDETMCQNFKDEEVLGQDDGHTQGLGGPDELSQPAPDLDSGGLDAPQSTATQPKPIATVDDDGEEDAYPDHAVPANNASYKDFLDHMVRELSVVQPVETPGPHGIVAGSSPGEKRKRVAFDPGCDDVANTRRKTAGRFMGPKDAQGGLEGEGPPAPFVLEQQAGHFASKIMNKIDRMVERGDVAGLRQCATMVECFEKRGCPGPKSSFAPYLNATSKRDENPRACNDKLREILDLFPDLEDVDVDNHVLAWLITGLRLTGQSINISLLEPCIRSFSCLYKDKFGDTANHHPTVVKGDIIDMVCRARDDAEKMVKKTPLNAESKVSRAVSKKRR